MSDNYNQSGSGRNYFDRPNFNSSNDQTWNYDATPTPTTNQQNHFQDAAYQQQTGYDQQYPEQSGYQYDQQNQQYDQQYLQQYQADQGAQFQGQSQYQQNYSENYPEQNYANQPYYADQQQFSEQQNYSAQQNQWQQYAESNGQTAPLEQDRQGGEQQVQATAQATQSTEQPAETSPQVQQFQQDKPQTTNLPQLQPEIPANTGSAFARFFPRAEHSALGQEASQHLEKLVELVTEAKTQQAAFADSWKANLESVLKATLAGQFGEEFASSFGEKLAQEFSTKIGDKLSAQLGESVSSALATSLPTALSSPDSTADTAISSEAEKLDAGKLDKLFTELTDKLTTLAETQATSNTELVQKLSSFTESQTKQASTAQTSSVSGQINDDAFNLNNGLQNVLTLLEDINLNASKHQEQTDSNLVRLTELQTTQNTTTDKLLTAVQSLQEQLGQEHTKLLTQLLAGQQKQTELQAQEHEQAQLQRLQLQELLDQLANKALTTGQALTATQASLHTADSEAQDQSASALTHQVTPSQTPTPERTSSAGFSQTGAQSNSPIDIHPPVQVEEITANQVQAKLSQLLPLLNQGLVEREKTLALTLLAALAGHNTFLLGPPGTAKSMLTRRLTLAFKQARYFELLMNRFTTPEELFGPVSLTKLKQDQYVRNTEGYLPWANFAFLDEVWKSSSAVLNSLLGIINEGLYKNGNQLLRTQLRSLIAASNEVPNADLDAMYDRFSLRLLVNPILDPDNFHQFIQAEQVADPQVPESLQFSQGQIEGFRNELKKVKLSEKSLGVIDAIRAKLGSSIYISDRRWVQAVSLLKASALANGRYQTNHLDDALLVHVLLSKPEQEQVITTAVRDAITKTYGKQQAATLKEPSQLGQLFTVADKLVAALKHKEPLYDLDQHRTDLLPLDGKDTQVILLPEGSQMALFALARVEQGNTSEHVADETTTGKLAHWRLYERKSLLTPFAPSASSFSFNNGVVTISGEEKTSFTLAPTFPAGSYALKPNFDEFVQALDKVKLPEDSLQAQALKLCNSSPFAVNYLPSADTDASKVVQDALTRTQQELTLLKTKLKAYVDSVQNTPAQPVLEQLAQHYHSLELKLTQLLGVELGQVRTAVATANTGAASVVVEKVSPPAEHIEG